MIYIYEHYSKYNAYFKSHCHSKVQVLVERTLIELTHFLEKYFNNYFFEDNFENLNCNLKFSNIGHSLGKYIQKV